MTSPNQYALSQLQILEAESIHIIREVVAQMEKPALLFSGGKDSIVLLHLAMKAFHPAPIPFPIVHVDTGHNFPEVLDFRDSVVEKHGIRLVVGSVQEAIDKGSVREEPNGSRNRIQTPVLLETIEQHGFDACMGGARRDEEKARAKAEKEKAEAKAKAKAVRAELEAPYRKWWSTLRKERNEKVGTPKTRGDVLAEIEAEESRFQSWMAVQMKSEAAKAQAAKISAAAKPEALRLFLALLALVDLILGFVSQQIGFVDTAGDPRLTLGLILGYLCWPMAWLMGIPAGECLEAGRLIGLKTVANEFIAYDALGKAEVGVGKTISERTAIVMTYALAGFSNFGAIGIQVGGIGGLEPARKKDLAQLGLRAMFGGLLACCMTGAIAGLLL